MNLELTWLNDDGRGNLLCAFLAVAGICITADVVYPMMPRAMTPAIFAIAFGCIAFVLACRSFWHVVSEGEYNCPNARGWIEHKKGEDLE